MLKKQQKAKSRKKGLLIFGLVAAGVTAGVAAWRASQPVEDPWKKPEPLSTSSPRPAEKPQPASSYEKPQNDGPDQSEAEKPSGKNVNAQPVEETKGDDVPKPKPAT